MANYHCKDGGTGVTNFSPKAFPIYVEAIKLYNRKVKNKRSCHFWIAKSPMKGPCVPTDYSLHVNSSKAYTSLFWTIFDTILDDLVAKHGGNRLAYLA